MSYPYYWLLLCILLSQVACKTQQANSVQKSPQENYRIAFYNVENLFDLKDNPQTLDEEFTPSGKKQWNPGRYQHKLDQLAKVLEGMQYPELLGLCEVENGEVLQDFIDKTSLAGKSYQYVHYDSPDKRGIDAAFMYQADVFKVMKTDTIRIHFPKGVVPNEPDYTTRDILYIKGLLKDRDTLHLFINHWPSRRGGVQQSEPKRLYVARQLANAVKTCWQGDQEANIIIMGDMNDETVNNSILELTTLRPPNSKQSLYNCMAVLDEQGKGSYNYRGNWNMLDHIIVSPSMANQKGGLRISQATIFRKDWMMYEDRKYGQRPSRSYGGPRYYGGYSDHLPIFVELAVY
ncbi:MAG: endonuclease [Bacteroidota bacterium]